ncbi:MULTISPECIES: ABC1 kinase family protein [Paenibacillus]|uniref:ABC1 kinase family protein n=1 Tax=Paenibacillus TaxID=44249 RepID=UPI00083D3D52|nr:MULTISPECIES: AarF/ABC1/UbiB kinase family protein [Paenibacillus]APB73877.1 ubiquinone biosynthesis regulatory protein kinase UbiB [Paenibacillus polymyxa]MCP3745766.1 AarF/ABC1/UbiB kinase family protein [Paenibacillus sp. A3M_27_13]ODB58537.1 ABC transporter [Paenibacillus polymyxa]OMF49706.1 ABC transporter [Paenibacillus peoriae]OMF80713.1 ABC transporter [Paenibacillus peoriae]
MAVRMKHAGRYREIAMALARHGFGYMVEEMGLFQLLSLPRKWLTRETPESKTLGERIRLVLEDLGPAFIKLGQLASTRADLLPEPIIRELVKLQDQVPPFSSETARGILEQELDTSLEDILVRFDDVPLAAASIGQVHLGKLHSGEMVAIKIQRPGVNRIIRRDLDILRELTAMAAKRWEWVERYQLRQMVEELGRSLIQELDYNHEARNTEKIALQFEQDPHIYIPKIYWDHTSSRILTMEFLDGTHLGSREELLRRGYNLKELAQRLVNSMLHQIFMEGFFHADPHPGNLLVLKNGSLAYLDFGMTGRLSEEMKNHLASLIIALMRKNTDAMVRSIERLGLVEPDTDLNALRADLDKIREDYSDVPFSQVSIGDALNDLFGAAQRHRIGLPSDVLLLGKALLTLEGVVEHLDPDLSIIALAEPFGNKLLKERFSGRRIRGKLLGGATELLETLMELPGQARQLASIISKGKLKLEVTVPELEMLLRRLDQISNRLSFSIVLLAFSIIMVGLIIGSSLNHQATMLWNVPAIEIGFVVALLMVAFLLYSIFKSGRF